MSSPTPDLPRIEQYLAADPSNPHLLTTAIDLCLSLGELDRAREHADAAVRALPRDPFMAARRGNVLIAQDQLDEAAQVFTQLLQQQPDPHIAYNLALVRFRQGDYAQARSVFEPFSSADDAPALGVTLLVRTLHHLDEIEQAIAVIERHLSRLGSDTDFLGAASLVYLDDDQLEKAHQLSAAALAGGGRPPLDALVAGGSAALGRDDMDLAKRMFAQALTISPSDGRSRSGLGMASLLEGELDEASDHLQRAVAAMPTDIHSWHALAWCQVVRDEMSDAERSFREALVRDAESGESHAGLALVQAMQGKKPEAQASVDRAKRLDPESAAAGYVDLILSGAAADPEQFRKIALGALAGRPQRVGAKLAEALAKRRR
jgi:tetratricopeptide (TPR) repeat protein